MKVSKLNPPAIICLFLVTISYGKSARGQDYYSSGGESTSEYDSYLNSWLQDEDESHSSSESEYKANGYSCSDIQQYINDSVHSNAEILLKNLWQTHDQLQLEKEVTDLCFTFKWKVDRHFEINIRACLNAGNNKLKMNYTELRVNDKYCDDTGSEKILKLLNANSVIKPYVTHPTVESSTVYSPYHRPCKLTSLSATPASSTLSTRSVVSSSSSSGTTVLPDGQTNGALGGSCPKAKEISHVTAVIIGVASFFAGGIVVLLCVGILHLKRTSKLCFSRSEKAPDKLTSDRVTKKVLAKHMLSDRNDQDTPNSAIHFVKETSGNTGQPTEDAYIYIDNQDSNMQPYMDLQDSMTRKSDQSKPQHNDEHVYKELDLQTAGDANEPTKATKNGTEKADSSAKDTNKLTVPHTSKPMTNSDVFDHTRDSTVSSHDYFVLQNENFRTSHRGSDLVSDSVTPPTRDQNVLNNVENEYFVLEKQ